MEINKEKIQLEVLCRVQILNLAAPVGLNQVRLPLSGKQHTHHQQDRQGMSRKQRERDDDDDNPDDDDWG